MQFCTEMGLFSFPAFMKQKIVLNTPFLAASLVLSALLGACAPATRVTLLPQANGTPSAVDVRTPQQTQALNQPFQFADVDRKGAITAGTTTAAQVRKDHPRLIALVPPPWDRFTLEFEPGTSVLTAASAAQLPRIIERAKARSGGEIVVVGHTDRQGAADANDRLSLERARAVRSLLIQQGFNAELIDAVGRGEREPLVPTDDDVVEPRNRRAEIEVR